MKKQTSGYRSWIRCIAAIVICAFLVNDCAFAAGSLTRRDDRDTLSPVSAFNPIVRIEERDGKFVIVEDPAETAHMVEGFQEDTGFVYLSLLIGQVIRRYGDRISAEALKALIRKHLSHINFTRFKWEDLRKEGDAFCLPYERKDDGRIQILRFYAPDTDIVRYPRSTQDKTNPLAEPDIVRIPLGDGLSVILEDPLEEEEPAAPEYSYADLVAEGYVVNIHPPETDDVLDVPRINVEILAEGGERDNLAKISYLVIEDYGPGGRGTIVIENFYPNFPEERKGRGRALLRYLLSRPEYSGYQVVSYASEQFQASFLQMAEYGPMTDTEGETVYNRIGKRMIDELSSRDWVQYFVQNVALYEKLQEIWFSATLYGRVPRQDGYGPASADDTAEGANAEAVEPGFPQAAGAGKDRELDLGSYEGLPAEEAADLFREDLAILMEEGDRIALKGMELVAAEERGVELWITEITDMVAEKIYRLALAAAVTDTQIEMLEHTDLDILKVAIKESVKNAVIWGNRIQPGRLVVVKWRLAPSGLVIDVTDEGEPFDIHAERELPEGVNRLLAGGSRGLAEHIAPFLSADSVRVTEGHRYIYGKPVMDIRTGKVVGKTLTLEFPAQLGRDLILGIAAGEGPGTLPAPHVNAVPQETFDFDRELFHVETERLWREPNLVGLWRDAVKDVLAEDIGSDIADQLIVYPRGGVLHGKWEEGDLDLTFYLNDWVYGHYGEEGLPYCRMVNRFMELARTAGLSVVEDPYDTVRAVQPSHRNDKFNQFPVHILNNRGNAIEIDIHDGPLSFLDPGLVRHGGAVGFVYDPNGNYYGRRDVLDMLDKYVGATRVDDLVSAKLQDIAQTVENLESYVQNIRVAYRSISRTAFADYLFRSYRKPFVRAVTIWKLLGREDMVEEMIRTLDGIDSSVRAGTYADPYQFLDTLDPLYDGMLRTFKDQVNAARMADLRADVNLRVYVSLGRHPHKKALKALLDDTGINYPDTWYQDISALPAVTDEYGGDLEAFVADAKKGLEEDILEVTPAYEALMAYLDPSPQTTLRRHVWMIRDLRERLGRMMERKLASSDPSEKTLTLWELGSGHLEPVLMAAIVLTEFDRHPAWGAPGEKIKVAVKCVDISEKVSGRIADVLENGFPDEANGNGAGNSITRHLEGEIEEYRIFVNTPANRRRIRDLGIIEPVRASVTDTGRVLSPLMETADVVYLSYVLEELGDRARYKVLGAVSDLKEGAVAYLRVHDGIANEIAGMVDERAEMKWKDDVGHDPRTHFALEGSRRAPPAPAAEPNMFSEAVRGKNVLFVSFRLNAEALDGVSLETDKWAQVMAEDGANVYYYSGETTEADFLKGGVTSPLAQAAFMNKRIGKLNKRIFRRGRITRKDDAELNEIKEEIKKDLRAYIRENNIEYLVAENILAYPGNISLSEAFIEVADELDLKVIAHSHDFWFERDEFLRKARPELRERLNNIVRGARRMTTVVINSAQKAKLEDEGLVQDVLIAPNVMDFAHPPVVPAPDDILRVREACEVEEGDIFMLAPVRPVPRKELHDALNVCEQLYKKTGREVKLIIPHPCAGRPYFRELVRYVRKIKGVKLVDVSEKIEHGDFTLEDTYHASDMVIYMSSLEGWGNGLVEAMYYRKPVIVRTYPVYQADIKTKGVRAIETTAFYSIVPKVDAIMRFLERLPLIGVRVRRFRQVSSPHIYEAISLLEDPWLVADMVGHNYTVSEREFSYETLRGILTDAIESAEEPPETETAEESGRSAMHLIGGPFFAAVWFSDDEFMRLAAWKQAICYAAGSLADILVPLAGYAVLIGGMWTGVMTPPVFVGMAYAFTFFAAASILNGLAQLVPLTWDFGAGKDETRRSRIRDGVLWVLAIATMPILLPMTLVHEFGHFAVLRAFGVKSARIVIGRSKKHKRGKATTDGKKILDLVKRKRTGKRKLLPGDTGNRDRKISRSDLPGRTEVSSRHSADVSAWPIRDNTMDMIVSRAAVNFVARDGIDTMYNAGAYASGYPEHSVKDYDESLGLRGRRGIVSRIHRWQRANPGDRFTFLDLGTGSAGVLRELSEREEVDQSRLTLVGVNSPDEEDVWAEYSADLMARSPGVSLMYFDYFTGWDGGDKDVEAAPGTRERFQLKMSFFLREIIRVLKPGGVAHIDVGRIEGYADIVDSVAAELKDKGHITYDGRTLHITKAGEKWTGPWAAVKRDVIRALIAGYERLFRIHQGRLRRLEEATRKVTYYRGEEREVRIMPYSKVDASGYDRKWTAIKHRMMEFRGRISFLEKRLESLSPPRTTDEAGTFSTTALKIPGPRRHVPDMEDRIGQIIDEVCRPVEQNEAFIVPEDVMGWDAINSVMRNLGLDEYEGDARCVMHVLDIEGESGKDLFGFPVVPGREEFSELVPVISYISENDGRVHVFVTSHFFDDFLQISHMQPSVARKRLRMLRMAEVVDHELFEHSEAARDLALIDRHRVSAMRSRHFIPRMERISAYHKWVINTLALTEEGREHLVLLLDESRPFSDDAGERAYEERFIAYVRDALPRRHFPAETQREAHHLLRVYSYGDMDAFGAICDRNGLDAAALNLKIEEEERKHVMNAVDGFTPDRVITDTNETNVEIDETKRIVKKTPNVSGPDGQIILDSYLLAQDRLGGLIADFSIVDGVIYQEKVVPVTEYLLHLAQGTGPFSVMADISDDRKKRMAMDVLVNSLECIREIARRGMIAGDCKLTNMGVRENGDVVLFDLGPSTFSRVNDFELMAANFGTNMYRLINLGNGVGGGEAPAMDPDKEEEVKRLRKEFARIWQGLTSVRTIAEGTEPDWKWWTDDEGEGDGMVFVRGTEEVLPADEGAAAREYRRITFVATDAAREGILQVIMENIEEVKAAGGSDTEKLEGLLRQLRERLRRTPYHSPTFDQAEFEDIVRQIEEIETAEGVKSPEDRFTVTYEDVDYEIHPYRVGTELPGSRLDKRSGVEEVKKKVSAIREENPDRPTFLRIGGRPGAGKTYFAREIKEQGILGLRPEEVLLISTDDFLVRGRDGDVVVNVGEIKYRVELAQSRGPVKLIIVEGVQSQKVFGNNWMPGQPDVTVFLRTPDSRLRWRRIVNRVQERARWMGPEYFLRSAIVRGIEQRYALDREEKDADVAINTGIAPEERDDVETPPGSIRSVFKYLCDNNVTDLDGALTGAEIAAEMGRSYETIKYDLRALYYHLHLAERDTSEGTGSDARYFVPERIRNKAGRVLPVLSRFRGQDLRPGVPLLEQVYRTEIEPRLNLPGVFPVPSYLDNPYQIEQNINRSFSRLDTCYGHDISAKVDERIKASGKARVLMIGVGRGFEAFELMHRYGDKVEITAISKEDLLYRHPRDLQKRFKEVGIDVSRNRARQYIRRLRRNHVEWDVEMGLPFERGDHDVAVFGIGVTEYIRRKYPVVEEAVRVVRQGGVVYVDLDALIIIDEGVEYSAEDYFRKTGTAAVTAFGLQRFRIEKGDMEALPSMEEIRAPKAGPDAPEWAICTYYRPVTRPRPVLSIEAGGTLRDIIIRLGDVNPYRRAAAAQEAANRLEEGVFNGQPALLRRLARALAAVTQDNEVVAVQAVRGLGLAGRHISFDRDVERKLLWLMGTVPDESPLFMELVNVFRNSRGGSLEFETEGTIILIRRLENTSDIQLQGVIISVMGELEFLVKQRHERTLENVFYVLKRVAMEGRYDASLVPGLFRNGVALGAEVIGDVAVFGRHARREAIAQMVRLFIRKADNTLERIWTSDFHRTPFRHSTERFFELYDTFLGMADPRNKGRYAADPMIRIAAAAGVYDILVAHMKYLNRVSQLERIYMPDGRSKAADEARQIQSIAMEDVPGVLRAAASRDNHAYEKTALLKVLLEWIQPGMMRAGLILPLVFDPNNTVCVMAAQVIVASGDNDAIGVVLGLARDRSSGVGKVLHEANSERTPGSIENVFAYLCENDITGRRKALSGEEIAERLGLSYETMKYDLRALSRHLMLLKRDTSRGVGRKAQYFVTPSARGRAERLLPVLAQFKGKDLRPTVDRLEDVYGREIAGILRETSRPVRAASELAAGDWVRIKRVNTETGRIIYEREMRVKSVTEADNKAVLQAERFGFHPNEEAHTYFNKGAVTTVTDEITLLPEPDEPFTVPYDAPEARMGEKDAPRAGEEPAGTKAEDEPEEEELSEFEAGEKAVAEKFIDALLVQVEARAIEAKELGQKIIIGIDTGWIPEEQQISVMSGLLNRLNRLSRQKGLDNIIIRRRKDGARLPAVIRKDMEETGTPLGNVIILGREALLGGKTFDSLRGAEGADGAFFAGVRLPEDFKEDSYVRLIEMLTIAVNLAFGEEVSQEEHPYVLFKEVRDRFYVLIPDATAYDYEILAKLYRIQKTVIDTGA